MQIRQVERYLQLSVNTQAFAGQLEERTIVKLDTERKLARVPKRVSKILRLRAMGFNLKEVSHSTGYCSRTIHRYCGEA
jgi:DNA-binding NarL/FixJ family response regulator